MIKETQKIRELSLVLAIVLGFIFIVSISALYVSDVLKNNNACGCVIPIPVMLLLLSSLGLFVGSLSFYILISKHLKEKKEVNKRIHKTLNFLPPEEKIVFKQLLNGLQSLPQLEKSTGFYKVKVHRIIKKLESKELVQKDQSKKIKLQPQLKEIFED